LPPADFKPLPDNQRAREAIATVLPYILWLARLILCSALIDKGHQESGAGRVRMVRVSISQLAQNFVDVFWHQIVVIHHQATYRGWRGGLTSEGDEFSVGILAVPTEAD
jgi:hypothetical protein